MSGRWSQCMSRWGHRHESPFCTSQPFHGLWEALDLQLSERFSALSSAELDHTLLFKEEDVNSLPLSCPCFPVPSLPQQLLVLSLEPEGDLAAFSATAVTERGSWHRPRHARAGSVCPPQHTPFLLSAKSVGWLGATRRRWPPSEAFVA